MIKLRITDTQIDYEGSITIGRKLLNGLLDGEKVTIHCLNGEQFDTYVIAGDKRLLEDVAKVLFYQTGESEKSYPWNNAVRDWPATALDKRLKAIRILDLCEEGVCVNGAAARKVQTGDIIEVSNKEGL